MMIPLKQWICDTCGELIEKPKDGWLEWYKDEDFKAQGFRICHHAPSSPRRAEGRGGPGCYAYDRHKRRLDNHLDTFLGPDGMIALLSDVHVGSVLDPHGKSPIEIGDHVSWAETFRRLHVPHYEEARQYFAEAKADDLFDGANQVWPFMQETLLEVIKRYGPSSEESDN